VTSSEPTIPAKLLTRLLHQHFQNEKTKVAKDANGVVAKYVDVFVREAIARAAYERAETDGNSGGRRVGDGFLEVCLPISPLTIVLY
jgi:histone H3/H4